MTTVLALLVGVGLLLFGRKVFWLFVGAVGFAAGLTLATRVLHDRPELIVILAALGAGLVGALLAIFLQRIAIRLAGLLAGGYLAVALMNQLGQTGEQFPLVPFLIGGLIGLILVSLVIDWAIIVLSSLTGAVLVVQALNLGTPVNVIVGAALLIGGILVQGRSKLARRSDVQQKS